MLPSKQFFCWNILSIFCISKVLLICVCMKIKSNILIGRASNQVQLNSMRKLNWSLLLILNHSSNARMTSLLILVLKMVLDWKCLFLLHLQQHSIKKTGQLKIIWILSSRDIIIVSVQGKKRKSLIEIK